MNGTCGWIPRALPSKREERELRSRFNRVNCFSTGANCSTSRTLDTYAVPARDRCCKVYRTAGALLILLIWVEGNRLRCIGKLIKLEAQRE